MKIEKLDNGRYRVRQQYNGTRYTVYFDHKPTTREVNLALADKMADNGQSDAEKGTMSDYAIKYMDQSKKEKKSPTTIRGYESVIKNTPIWFTKLQIDKVSDKRLQELVDEYYQDHSAKSTKNMYSLWHSILAEYRPYIKYTVKLPTASKKRQYEPSTSDIKAILNYSKGSRYYLCLKMASIGLRRGEFCAITSADLSKSNVLTINKDMVVDSNNNQIIKDTPKTDASNRSILIPEDIADMIRSQGYVFKGNMHTINRYLHDVQNRLGIPNFPLHTMRHFAAAYMIKKGFTTVQIEDYMGWEHGSSVMQKVYAYNLDPEEAQKPIAKAFFDLQ